MSLQYIFVIHVYIYLGIHQSEVYELWIVRVVEAGNNIVYHRGDDPSVQQSMSCNSLHVTTFPLLSTCIYAFISTTSTVTILCTCPIMHDKVIYLATVVCITET